MILCSVMEPQMMPSVGRLPGPSVSTIISALLLFVMIAGGGYMYYISQQRIQELNAELSNSTAKVALLRQQVSQLLCKGTWSNGTCIPLSVTLSADPTEGGSPLRVTFTVKVPDGNYSIDFGDGSTAWVSGGLNAQSQGNCVQDLSGLCTVTITHAYTTNAKAKFIVKLMQNNVAVTSTVVNIVIGRHGDLSRREL
jgi:hypothetical protein